MREAAWIAEVDGRRAGCILLVSPETRGLGVGSVLAEECLDFARAAGYDQVTL